MKKNINGNESVAIGVKLCRVEVVPGFTITPQTTIVEHISGYAAKKELKVQYVNVESEFAAINACIGASFVGSRTFTATSANGLHLMYEGLPTASTARLPIVMAVVNRATGFTWNIWPDLNDAMTLRDAGWLQFYCENAQEVLDTIIQAYKISEKIYLPTMVNLEGFILSHTSEIVDIPEQEQVDKYLPPFKPLFKLDPQDPHTFGSSHAVPDEYFDMRRQHQETLQSSAKIAKEAEKEFEEIFGRKYGAIETYRTEDAQIILITMGTAVSVSRASIDEAREKGIKAGLVKIRLLRPFPKNDLVRVLDDCKFHTNGRVIGVLDRDCGSILYHEVRSALHNAYYGMPIFGYVAGIGGAEINQEIIDHIIRDLKCFLPFSVGVSSGRFACDKIVWLQIRQNGTFEIKSMKLA